MKSRSNARDKVAQEIEVLGKRLEAARAESRRIAANRGTTERKLDGIGRQIAELKSELAVLAAERARQK